MLRLEDVLSTWRYLSFNWVNCFLVHYKYEFSGINTCDLPTLLKYDEPLGWIKKMSLGFREQEEDMHEGEYNPFNFEKAILKVFGWDMTLCILLKLAFIISSLYSSVYLSKLLKSGYSQDAVNYGVILTVVLVVKIFLDVHSKFLIGRLSLRIGATVMGISFERILYGSENSTRSTNPKPQIFNLILGDIDTIEPFITSITDIILSPIRIFGSWYILRSQVGFAATPSVVTFVFMMVLSFVFQVLGALQKQPFMYSRDLRIKKCHEYFSNIMTMRMLFWEDIIYKKIMSLRKNEVKANMRRLVLLSTGIFLDYNTHSLAQYVLFCCYFYMYMMKNSYEINFSMTVALTTLYVLYSLTNPARNLISKLLDGMVSYNRYKAFICSYSLDINKNTESSIYRNTNKKLSGYYFKYISEEGPIIRISRSDLIFDKSSLNYEGYESIPQQENQFVLRIRDLEIKSGECLIVTGKSGSGKSSFLRSILGKMSLTSGSDFEYSSLLRDSPVAYCSQYIWLPRGTVRSAILFGRFFDETKYKAVIECCQLVDDFNNWEEGDLRIIDESGYTLSGGQRSRICLARALYSLSTSEYQYNTKSKVKLFILDDVFVNIDPQTSHAIFKNMFDTSGLLCNVCCIISCDFNTLESIYPLRNRHFIPGLSLKIATVNDGLIVSSSNLYSYTFPNKEVNESSISTSKYLDKQFTGISYVAQEISNTNKIINNKIIKRDTMNEHSIVGRISRHTYSYYIKLIGIRSFVLFVFACILKSIIDKFNDLYIGCFSSINNLSSESQSKLWILRNFTFENYICLYSVILFLKLSIGLSIFISETFLGIRASESVHDKLLYKLINVPFSFYNSNPLGKIINRFNVDILNFDNGIIHKIAGVILNFLNPIIQMAILTFLNPRLSPLIIVYFCFIVYKYGKPLFDTFRASQRIMLVTSSFICTLFSEIQSGKTTISCFCAQSYYTDKFSKKLEIYLKAQYLKLSIYQRTSFRLQIYTAPLAVIISSISVAYTLCNENLTEMVDTSNDMKRGYLLLYFLFIAEILNRAIGQASILEKDMCSVERIQEYNEMILEHNNFRPSNSFYQMPKVRTGIVVENLQVDYCPFGNTSDSFLQTFTVFRNLNLKAKPFEHVGIIGRTGCGKSTFLSTLIGILPISKGRILLDGCDILTIPNHIKREIIGVLPQSPLKLNGWTVRQFLDPLNWYNDQSIWQALHICGLSEVIQNFPGGKGIDSIIICDDGYKCYLSDTQIRYLSIVRLILQRHKYRLLIIDEPPSIGDNKTEYGYPNHKSKSLIPIYDLINLYFRHCNVFIIAHRLLYLQKCDRIVRLSDICLE
ncbi:ABC transporter family protein [Cryptosporidium andersoni]|uniref:ABC transporter family protein n=1 Tax=Cryptosporidium andersoni TaxID=117008 RepID=A0A1J4MSV6_9CRYT|nr:ABC transporter family protein [Cryptosporidium andersoni]